MYPQPVSHIQRRPLQFHFSISLVLENHWCFRALLFERFVYGVPFLLIIDFVSLGCLGTVLALHRFI